MEILFHRRWEKKYTKLSLKLQKQVDKKLILFSKQPSSPVLNNHPLKGRYDGYRSINITGDYRAIYKEINPDIYQFVEMGTHSDLYS